MDLRHYNLVLLKYVQCGEMKETLSRKTASINHMTLARADQFCCNSLITRVGTLGSVNKLFYFTLISNIDEKKERKIDNALGFLGALVDKKTKRELKKKTI